MDGLRSFAADIANLAKNDARSLKEEWQSGPGGKAVVLFLGGIAAAGTVAWGSVIHQAIAEPQIPRTAALQTAKPIEPGQ